MQRMDSDWYQKIWTLDIQDQSWVEDTERQFDFIVRKLNLTGKERISCLWIWTPFAGAFKTGI